MILVDDLVHHAKSPLGPRSWCHMASDKSLTELHEMAKKIGMRREWFQGDHYDLVASRRSLAIKYGAVAVSGQELAKRRVGAGGDRLRALLAGIREKRQAP